MSRRLALLGRELPRRYIPGLRSAEGRCSGHALAQSNATDRHGEGGCGHTHANRHHHEPVRSSKETVYALRSFGRDAGEVLRTKSRYNEDISLVLVGWTSMVLTFELQKSREPKLRGGLAEAERP